MLQWEHFKEPSVVTVFLALLLSVDRDGKTMMNLDGLMSVTGMSHNTVTRAIASLVKSGEIERTKQGPRICTTITNWSEYQDNLSTQILGDTNNLSYQKLGCKDDLLTQNLGEQKNLSTQNLGEQNGFIDPKFGSIIYNKNNNKNINNNGVVDAHTHEEFIADALNDLRIEQGCMAMRITPDEYKQLVDEVTKDWIFRNLPDNEWTLTHLLAQMRIKHQIKQNGNNNGQRTSQNGNGEVSTVRGFKIHQA